MESTVIIGLAAILIIGVGAQWLAWRLHLPSILLLLIAGFCVGPLSGWLDPDHLLGELLQPFVSLAVAIILFEGGLSLSMSELKRVGKVVRNLVTIGAMVTWIVISIAAYWILGLDLKLSLLVGAILIVTGPTVIGPLIRHVRPNNQISSILKWEGIVIDPIGAMFAVLIFEVIISGEMGSATSVFTMGLFKTIVFGGLIGYAGAKIIIFMLKNYWVPDFLHSAVTLAMVILCFTVTQFIQADAGLLTVTIMGIVMANQQQVAVKHIIEFKEHLRVLLIAILFIILSARLDIHLLKLDMPHMLFLGVVLLIARPLSVWVSTIGSGLNLKERIFLSWVAPRGIVAASVASIFALHLGEAGYPNAEQIAGITFLCILVTVAVSAITAAPLAQALGLANANPQGVLIGGAHDWARSIGRALHQEGYPVMLADTNWANVAKARMDGLPTSYGSILSDYMFKESDFTGIGKLFAMTSNDAVNALAVQSFEDMFGSAELYQLSPRDEEERNEHTSHKSKGRFLFKAEATFDALSQAAAEGAECQVIELEDGFDIEQFRQNYGEQSIPLFLIQKNGDLTIFTQDNPADNRPGVKVIALTNYS